MNINLHLVFLVVSSVSLVLILIGSIKLLMLKNIPGSWLIFFAMLCGIIVMFLPETDADNNPEFYWKLVIAGVNAVAMLAAAIGFLRLCNYACAQQSGNKSTD